MSLKRSVTVLGICLLALSFVGITWKNLNPSLHFQKQVPILVEPGGPGEDEPAKIRESLDTPCLNTLILGTDSWEGEAARTDLIMLVKINIVNKQVHILSIPRDTRVEIPGIGWTKINHAHMIGESNGGNEAGTQATLQAISNLLQCSINYYAKIDFAGFEHLVDTIGGLTVELPQQVKLSHINRLLPEGEQILDGGLARELVRERFSLPDGDFGRQKLQFIVLKALTHKLLSPEGLRKLPGYLTLTKSDLVDTNFTESDLLSLARLFQGLNGDNITYTQLPGKNGYDFDPLVQAPVYYWYPDLASLPAIRETYLN